jgi:hypothetical protein
VIESPEASITSEITTASPEVSIAAAKTIQVGMASKSSARRTAEGARSEPAREASAPHASASAPAAATVTPASAVAAPSAVAAASAATAMTASGCHRRPRGEE